MTSAHPIGGPAAWLGSQITDSPEWRLELDAADRAELLTTLARVRSLDRQLREVNIGEFTLPRLGQRFAAALADVVDGRGFVLIRGLPIENLCRADVEMLLWGVGLHFGRPIHQKNADDLLVRIADQGVDPTDPLTRGFQTSTKLDYHCDSADIVGLLCVRPAKAGGVSTIVSSVAVHDELVRVAPECADLLHQQWWHDRKTGNDLDSFFECSVFAERDGRLFAHYGRSYMESASRHPDIPELSAERVRALDALDTLLNSPQYALNMDFRVGDLQLLNNYRVMHARTEYQDHPEPERKRELIRLWLTVPGDLGLPEDFAHAGIVARDTASR